MLPLKDLNPTRRIPVITYALIAVSVIVFFWELSKSANELQELFFQLAVVPKSVVQDPFALDTILDFIRSIFFHAGWAHLIGNMLFLWLFADNIEDRMGIPLFIIVFFVCGIVAAIAQILVDPTSPIPMIGASGAIAGILGAYLVLFPGVKVRGIVPFGGVGRIAEWPAWIMLVMWFVLQLFNGVVSLGINTGASGGVAFFAHIGGFVAGVVIALIFLKLYPQPPREQRNEILYERARRYRY